MRREMHLSFMTINVLSGPRYRLTVTTLKSIAVAHLQSPGWQPTLCVAWGLTWWFARLERVHGTECPYWGQVSLNNTNQTKPNHCTGSDLKVPMLVAMYENLTWRMFLHSDTTHNVLIKSALLKIPSAFSITSPNYRLRRVWHLTFFAW